MTPFGQSPSLPGCHRAPGQSDRGSGVEPVQPVLLHPPPLVLGALRTPEYPSHRYHPSALAHRPSPECLGCLAFPAFPAGLAIPAHLASRDHLRPRGLVEFRWSPCPCRWRDDEHELNRRALLDGRVIGADRHRDGGALLSAAPPSACRMNTCPSPVWMRMMSLVLSWLIPNVRSKPPLSTLEM